MVLQFLAIKGAKRARKTKRGKRTEKRVRSQKHVKRASSSKRVKKGRQQYNKRFSKRQRIFIKRILT